MLSYVQCACVIYFNDIVSNISVRVHGVRICVKMAEHHTASTVANYLSTVESDSASDDEENGQCSELSLCVKELSEEDEDVSIVEPTERPADIGRTATDEGESVGHSSSSIDLIPKKGTKSEVWRHFGLAQENGMVVGKDKPVCRLCSAKVSAKDGNTTNLFAHLKTKHPELYVEAKKSSSKIATTRSTKCCYPNQLSIKESLLRGKKLATNSKEHIMLTKSVTYWLAKDSQPEYAVEKLGFKHMLKVFNPRYECSGRNYFSRIAIPKLYTRPICDRIKHTLSSSEVGFFSATTDLWTSCARDPFLSYKVHYISPDWELKNMCLCTHYIVEDHTGENLKVSFLEIFEEWNLSPDHQVAITTDSGSNIKLACRLLGWKRLPCFAHNLDLAITKGLRDSSIEEVLQVCHKVVSKFSQSWKRTRDLAISQR